MIAIVLLCITPGIAHCFTISNFTIFGQQPGFLVAPGNHEKITREALYSVIVNDLVTSQSSPAIAPKLQFKAEVVEAVVFANTQIDNVTYDIPVLHFDDENFSAGNSLLRSRRAEITSEAKNGYFLLAAQRLGWALHTVQDFYSHSTWVEANPSRMDIAGLGRDVSFLAPEHIGDTCNSQGILPGAGLTSGYFHYNQAVISSNDWSTFVLSLPFPGNMKCIHGIGSIAATENGGAGVNKDQKIRGPLFDNAFALAKVASIQFVSDVLSDLADFPIARCGLLGFDVSSCGRELYTLTARGGGVDDFLIVDIVDPLTHAVINNVVSRSFGLIPDTKFFASAGQLLHIKAIDNNGRSCYSLSPLFIVEQTSGLSQQIFGGASFCISPIPIFNDPEPFLDEFVTILH